MSTRFLNIALGSVLPTIIVTAIAFGQEGPGRTPNPARLAQMEAAARAHPILPIGSPAPDFVLPGGDGRMHRLSDYASYPVMVVLFNCVHCPMAQLYESRVQRLYDDYKNKGVGFVVINPNSEAALGPGGGGGYSDMSDSLEGIMVRVRYRHMTYPYLHDGETQGVTRAYGPTATPHIFVFDKERKLQYEGRIDDSPREPLAKSFDARNALDAVLAGKPAPVTHTASFGCSTKWINLEAQQATMAKVLAEPVTLDMATADDLKKLRANQTDKTVVVYFWATWMQTSVDSLPRIVETYHWFRGRKVDVVTVSTNSPEDKAAVTKALQDAHAGTHNLLLASDHTSELLRAFDSTWETGVPFTVIIAPGGQVIYHETGEIRPQILAERRALLATRADATSWPGHASYWAPQP
jgi:peroxiredoxin